MLSELPKRGGLRGTRRGTALLGARFVSVICRLEALHVRKALGLHRPHPTHLSDSLVPLCGVPHIPRACLPLRHPTHGCKLAGDCPGCSIVAFADTGVWPPATRIPHRFAVLGWLASAGAAMCQRFMMEASDATRSTGALAPASSLFARAGPACTPGVPEGTTNLQSA